MPIGKRKYIRKMVARTGRHPKELASCYGKIRYSSYADAKTAADTKPERVKAYKCRYCANYHIGKRST